MNVRGDPKTLMRPHSASGATDEHPRRVIPADTSRLEARQPKLRFRFRGDFHVKHRYREEDPLPLPPPGRDKRRSVGAELEHRQMRLAVFRRKMAGVP